MKMKLKKGFTLAELLVCIAIISIISTMGIVISKKGMDKAYDYYVYNSYKSISSAIGDAISNGYSYDFENSDFSKYLQSLFSSQILVFNPDGGNNFALLSLNNGVVYKFNKTKEGHIRILLPSANSEGRILDFYLDPDHYEYGLIPASNEVYNNSLSVLDRIDLLPFTIDDGETGKIVSRLKEDFSDFEDPAYLDEDHKTIERYSYKKAFCNLQATGYDETITDWNNREIKFEISCDAGITEGKGVLRLLNPKKVF